MSKRSNEQGNERGDRGSQGRGDESLSLNNVLRTEENKPSIRKSFIRRMPFSERNSFPRLLALTAAGLLLAALPALAKSKPVPVQTAVIVNTGSTNTFGYTITVSLMPTRFHVISVSNNGRDNNSGSGTLKQMEARVPRLFADLDAAMPLTSLPVRHGMRSASFGTQTFIIYKGQKSPDLNFAAAPRALALKMDINDFVKAYGARNTPKHPGPLLVIKVPATSP